MAYSMGDGLGCGGLGSKMREKNVASNKFKKIFVSLHQQSFVASASDLLLLCYEPIECAMDFCGESMLHYWVVHNGLGE